MLQNLFKFLSLTKDIRQKGIVSENVYLESAAATKNTNSGNTHLEYRKEKYLIPKL